MIYYFEGNLENGINLTSILEDISINRQKKMFGKVLISPNTLSVEGERKYRIYYLNKYYIKFCKKLSIKGLLIKIIGKELKVRDKELYFKK